MGRDTCMYIVICFPVIGWHLSVVAINDCTFFPKMITICCITEVASSGKKWVCHKLPNIKTICWMRVVAGSGKHGCATSWQKWKLLAAQQKLPKMAITGTIFYSIENASHSFLLFLAIFRFTKLPKMATICCMIEVVINGFILLPKMAINNNAAKNGGLFLLTSKLPVYPMYVK